MFRIDSQELWLTMLNVYQVLASAHELYVRAISHGYIMIFTLQHRLTSLCHSAKLKHNQAFKTVARQEFSTIL